MTIGGTTPTTIEGIEFVGAGASYSVGGVNITGIPSSGSHKLRHCIIHDTSSTRQAVYIGAAATVDIYRCNIYDGISNGIYAAGVGCTVRVCGSDSYTLRPVIRPSRRTRASNLAGDI